MRETDTSHPIAAAADVHPQAPWLSFAIHHSGQAGRRSRQTAIGPTLAAEASIDSTFAVLVGPSGAGKTSLLRALAGLLRPERGHIALAGNTVMDSARGLWVDPGRRGFGLVTQRPALFPSLTAGENIAFGLQFLAHQEKARRVAEMATLFRLESLLLRRPAQLSGGEQQRVAVARAVAPHPRALLVDEPFAGLNLELKTAILDDLEGWLLHTNTPLLYVTHDIAEAWRVGSRSHASVLRMESGRIVNQGPAPKVLSIERTELLRTLQ